MKLKYTSHLFLTFLIISGCNKQNTGPQDSKIFGLASPILLTNDTTRVAQSDYFTQPVFVDSVISDDNLQISFFNDFIFLVKNNKTKPLSNITIYAEGIPYSILVINESNSPTHTKTDKPSNNGFPHITTESFSNSEIIISTQNTELIYAYWENFRLEAKIQNKQVVVKIPPFAKYQNRSHILIYGSSYTHIANDVLIPLEKGKVITKTSKLNSNDLQSSIIYALSVNKFAKGDNTNNILETGANPSSKTPSLKGDLLGITQKIREGYFKELGINTICISPITPNKKSEIEQVLNTKNKANNRIQPLNFTAVDYTLGGEKAVKELLHEAHKNGLSVILELAPNYIHNDHWINKKHPEWLIPPYIPTNKTAAYPEKEELPTSNTHFSLLDLDKTEAAKLLIDSTAHWVTYYDFDGFRYYTSPFIPEDFWHSLTEKIKKTSQEKGKNILQLGDIQGGDITIQSLTSSGTMDGQLDYAIYEQAIQTFSNEDHSFEKLASTLLQRLNIYGSHHLMGNMSGYHNTSSFLELSNQDIPKDAQNKTNKSQSLKSTSFKNDHLAYQKLALFHAFNLTIPGIPIIYFGDEIGMTYPSDSEDKQLTIFKPNAQQAALKKTVSELIKLRNENMALLYGDFQLLQSTDKVLSYKRSYFDNVVIVTLNKETWQFDIKVE